MQKSAVYIGGAAQGVVAELQQAAGFSPIFICFLKRGFMQTPSDWNGDLEWGFGIMVRR